MYSRNFPSKTSLNYQRGNNIFDGFWEIPEPLSTDSVKVDDDATIVRRRHGNPAGPRLVLSHGSGLTIPGPLGHRGREGDGAGGTRAASFSANTDTQGYEHDGWNSGESRGGRHDPEVCRTSRVPPWNQTVARGVQAASGLAIAASPPLSCSRPKLSCGMRSPAAHSSPSASAMPAGNTSPRRAAKPSLGALSNGRR